MTMAGTLALHPCFGAFGAWRDDTEKMLEHPNAAVSCVLAAI